jgi:hypothetical protein
MRRVLTLLMGLFFFCTFHAQEVVRYVTANLNLRDSLPGKLFLFDN